MLSLFLSFDNSDKFPLYFDVEKTIKIDIKIYKDSNCEDLLNKNHQIIQKKLTENSVILNSKNKFTDYKMYFVIISTEYPTTRIKLKPNDKPRKYLDLSKEMSLFFIPIKNKNSKLESINKIHINQSSNNKNKAIIINYVKPEDCLREGHLKKYNFSNKKFELRKVNVDKYKLIILYSNDSNLWKVIYLNDIKTIIKGTKEQQIKGTDDTFEITLSDNETYIFQAENTNDREEWYKVINSFVIQIKENNYLYSLSLINNNIMKEIYQRQISIIFNYLSLRGVLALEKTRNIYFKYLNNLLLQQTLEKIINYKIAINKNYYFQSLRLFLEIMELLELKNFDLDNYHQKKYDLKRITKKIEPQNNNQISKEYILENMNSFKTLKSYIQILKVFQDIYSKKNKMDNKNKIFIETIKKYLKNNTLNELFDNLIYSIHKNFHSKIVKNPEFLIEIKRAIIYYLKPSNFCLRNNYLSLPQKKKRKHVFY